MKPRFKWLLTTILPLLLFVPLYGLRGGSQAHRRAVEEDAAAAAVLMVGLELPSRLDHRATVIYVAFVNPSRSPDPSNTFIARFRKAPFVVKKGSQRRQNDLQAMVINLSPKWENNAQVSVQTWYYRDESCGRGFTLSRAWFPWPHGTWRQIGAITEECA